MLLIDATYISASGGLELLKYIVNKIEATSINAYYIFDKRAESSFSSICESKRVFITGSEFNRLVFYLCNYKKFRSVLCFGNVPPPIPIKATVFTYFHNVLLLKGQKGHSVKSNLVNYLKRMYIYICKSNADKWIVQTDNVKELIRYDLFIEDKDVLQIPFFNIEKYKSFAAIEVESYRQDYAYIANYIPEKNHENLIKSWILLAEMNKFPVLHITISEVPKHLQFLLDSARLAGCKIINHGRIPFSKVHELYSCSKAVVYPSYNESFGLGIIEALIYGCDIIGSNHKYIYSVCSPSEVFNPSDVNSIADSILRYELSNSSSSVLLVENQIDLLLSTIR